MRVQTRVSHYRNLYRAVREMLEEGLPLQANRAAALAGFSRSHFSRFCTTALHENPGNMLRRMRLDQAAYLLRTTSRTAAEIAVETGYSGPEAFSRAFRQRFNCTPREFRIGPLPFEGSSPQAIRIEPDSETALPVEIVHRDPARLATLRHIGSYSDTAATWEALKPFVPESASRFYSVYHVDSERYPEASLRADLGFEVPPGYMPMAPLQLLELPGGEYVRTAQELNDSQYNSGWKAMSRTWLPRSGRRPANIPSFEEYADWPLPFETCKFHIFIGLELSLLAAL